MRPSLLGPSNFQFEFASFTSSKSFWAAVSIRILPSALSSKKQAKLRRNLRNSSTESALVKASRALWASVYTSDLECLLRQVLLQPAMPNVQVLHSADRALMSQLSCRTRTTAAATDRLAVEIVAASTK